jgi:hypothetical protein
MDVYGKFMDVYGSPSHIMGIHPVWVFLHLLMKKTIPNTWLGHHNTAIALHDVSFCSHLVNQLYPPENP